MTMHGQLNPRNKGCQSSLYSRKKSYAMTTMSAWLYFTSATASAFATRSTGIVAFAGKSLIRPTNSLKSSRTSSFLRRQEILLGLAHPRRTSTLAVSTSPPDSTSGSTAAIGSSDGKEKYDILNKERGLGCYEPSKFESEIYQWWENSGCFEPDAKHNPKGGKEPYVLPMPPPNVTGRLHMGHAIFVALQDVLARFHRMRGRPVLWLPGMLCAVFKKKNQIVLPRMPIFVSLSNTGTDHAGIATQLQVEKQLAVEGTSREEVGRQEFLRRVWMYKEEQGGHITRQLRSLGASADWSRERFTMDSDLCGAVTEAFVRLHEKGLIYRGEYMVNWAPLLETAVSDLEVEYSEEEGKLYYFKYIVEGSEGGL